MFIGFVQPPPRGIVEVLIIVNSSLHEYGLNIEKHEPGQSLHNFQLNLLEGMEYQEPKYQTREVLTPIEMIALKKSTFDCYEDNSMKMTNCINDYINQKLDCILPWTTKASNMKLCRGPEKLIQFRKLHADLTSKESKTELFKKGCMKPNCVTRKWKKSYKSTKKNTNTVIRYTLPSNIYTIKKQEILLADFSTFLADCGSYLGLFLGASILSLTDLLAFYLRRFYELMRKIAVSLKESV